MKECLCDKCPDRFVCFTQRKVFSDPYFQAMYESYLAQGLSKEEAAKNVGEFAGNMKEALTKRIMLRDSTDYYIDYINYEKRWFDKCVKNTPKYHTTGDI